LHEPAATAVPQPPAYDRPGSTRDVYGTRAGKSHVSQVVLDSGWEGRPAEALEDMTGADKFTAGSGTDTATDHTLSQGDTLAVRARPEYYAAFL